MAGKDIIVARRPSQDACYVAARAAELHGTRLAGNLRWYGEYHRAVATDDGREVRVYEPEHQHPDAITIE